MTMNSDLSALADDQTKTAKTRLDQTAAKLKDSAGMMQARMGDFAEEARTYADRTVGQLSAFSRTAIEKAKERPATSAIVVLGVGIAVGAILAMTLRGPAESALDGAGRLRRKLHS
jgi:ElaB/YqjD/DUF883 family membrane-anchored ribosome-binding protein